MSSGRLHGKSYPVTIACAGKDGFGKSTTAIDLAVIASQTGYRVAIVDSDSQQSAVFWRGTSHSNIPVVPCNPALLNIAAEKALRAGVYVLFIDMEASVEHVTKIRSADFVLVTTCTSLFDIGVTRYLTALLDSAYLFRHQLLGNLKRTFGGGEIVAVLPVIALIERKQDT